MTRKLWTAQEDALLSKEAREGVCDESSWERVAQKLRSAGHKKSAKQCRERWANHLDPALVRTEWLPEDNIRLLDLHEKSGSHWKKIANYFPGRTDNSIKNQFFSLVRKSLRKARKSVSKNANTTEVNSIKPKVLSNILSQEIVLPADVIPTRGTVPQELNFLGHMPVHLKDFVTCFAFSKISESTVQNNEELTRAVDFVLRSLERQNREYVGSKNTHRTRRSKIRKSKPAASRIRPKVSITELTLEPQAAETPPRSETPRDHESADPKNSPAPSEHGDDPQEPYLFVTDTMTDDLYFNAAFLPQGRPGRREEFRNSSSFSNSYEYNDKERESSKHTLAFDDGFNN